ncbi:type II secretion system F family protein [Paludibacterium purpuratum]|uniref:Type IV pilus assembly protein PilC n=1 Tax=Paludibacterium purpuratum TaxID=1144873 RepID=A0A4R7B434_9NEIS|nr:type II secretion system F family protein [Paludibacterium purpuratum]TDR76745.1 type IV pilus assembly protein PilC [Paludibacterium purpuratum]
MWGTLWRPVSPAGELAWLLRQLATLLQAGVPLAAALQCLQEGSLSPTMRGALRATGLALECGESLSRALDRFPQLFCADVRAALAAAEESGQLASTMAYLAAEQESRIRLVAKVRQALVYPCMILLTGVCVMLVVCLTVLPALRDSFSTAGQPLPGASLAVLWLADALAERGLSLLGALLLAGVLLRRAWRRHVGCRLLVTRAILRIPLWGRLLRQSALARWSRTLWLLQTAGVPLSSALPMAGLAAGNPILAELSRTMSQQLREGISLNLAMARTGWFPPLLTQLVRVGEQSGALQAMFERAACHFSDEVEHSLVTLTSLLEPLSMVLLGLMCGGLIWALYLPIFQLGETVM